MQISSSSIMPSEVLPRLILGTVQFGLPYGVANTKGQIPREEAAEILELGTKAGLTTLDTAIAYGESEAILGSIGVRQWRIITKLPKLPNDCMEVESWVRKQVEGSLERLKVERLQAVMMHRPEDLLGPQGGGIIKGLQLLKDEGVISESGISVYSPAELDPFLSAAHFDIVQAPFNILDRSLLKTDHFFRLKASGTKLHLRSIFLQGLLLMDLNSQNQKFPAWSQIWAGLSKYLTENRLSPLEICLRFAFAAINSDGVLVGVDSLDHFKQILNVMRNVNKIFEKNENSVTVLPKMPDLFDCCDVNLINPSRWSR